MRVCRGSSRIVVLIGRFAVKIPNVREYRLFLHGLLANMQEVQFWKAFKSPKMAPILFSLPWGFMVVMERAEALQEREFDGIDVKEWADIGDYVVPVEDKLSSFGVLDGRIVAVDYGS